MTSEMSPEQTVKRQLDAYNARDIDAFMACWHPEAEFIAHPDTVLARGHAEICARHELRFQEPDLFGHLISRLTLGDRVIDQERVVRNMEGRKVELDVVAIYEVIDGLIRRAWFLMGTPRDID